MQRSKNVELLVLEKKILKNFNRNGRGAILVMQPGPSNKLSLPFYMKLGFDWLSVFWRSLKMVNDGWTTDGRTTPDDAYTIST